MLELASPPEEERNRILAAASLCIRVHGFKATSIEMIARQAGVSAATMRRYFASIEVIVAALAIRHLETIEADINGLGPDPGPMAIVNAVLEHAKEWTVDGEASLFFIFLAEAEHNPLVGQILRKSLHYARAALAESISREQLRGAIASDIDAQATAILISVISHASLIVRLLNSEAEAEEVDRLFLSTLQTMLLRQGGSHKVYPSSPL